MADPKDLKYTRTHEWVRAEGDVGVVGITQHAVDQLGDLAFVDLPEPGARAERGSRFGEIESTKTVSDLVAPVSGEIVEVHDALAENLQDITGSPYDAGWMVRIRLADPAQLDDLLSWEEYEAHAAAEEH